MAAYSRWTARIALVALGLITIAGLAVIPAGSGYHGGTVWPIPEPWGKHHVIACIEMVVVYIALGLVVLIVAITLVGELWDRADW